MKVKIFSAFAGYDAMLLSLKRLARNYPQFSFECVGYSEIDKYACIAHDALHPDIKSYGDITAVDWSTVPDFDILTWSSPCFCAGTLVFTNRGYIPIEGVKIGDMVLTHTNQFQRVIAVGSKMSDNVYRVRGMGFCDTFVTGNHPYYVRRRYRKGHQAIRMFDAPEWKSISSVTKDDFYGYAISQVEELPNWDGVIKCYGSHWDVVNELKQKFIVGDFWYLMGRYVGDGWRQSYKGTSKIVIACSKRNEESLVWALNKLGFAYSKSVERTVYKYTIVKKELCEFVKRYGMYAHGKRVDVETINLPTPLLQEFVRGYIDSDGHYDEKTDSYSTTTVSRMLAFGMQQCISKAFNCHVSMTLYHRPPTYTIEGRIVNQRDTYSLRWHTSKKRQDKAFFESKQCWMPINIAEKQTGWHLVYNLEVEDDNSYTANGAIVHNCQSVSAAGQLKGMTEGTDAASAVIWSIDRCLAVKHPKYILLENVANIVGARFIGEFNRFQDLLRGFGYKCHTKIMNAKQYGVPQNRERLFLVATSEEVDGYHFQEPFALEKRLKDVLEQDVDERYYLSADRVAGLLKSTLKERGRGNGFAFSPKTEESETANCITTREGGRKTANFIAEDAVEVVGNLYDGNPQAGRVYDPEGIAPTLRSEREGLKVKEQYLLNGDKDGCFSTLTTGHDRARNITEPKGGHKQIGVLEYDGRIVCIRRLTERELFRIMDVDEPDIDILLSAGIPKTQLAKLAGNSIVVNCLYHIFRKMFIDVENESQQTLLF